MMMAAVASNLRVLRMRPAGLASASSSLPRTRGMTATPVSKPERPSAILGKSSRAMPSATQGFPCSVITAPHHEPSRSPRLVTSRRARPITTRFSARYKATIATAIPIASLKPFRNTPPRATRRIEVTSTAWSSIPWGT
jgi:hypothetical protein